MDQQHEYILNVSKADKKRADEYVKRYILRFCPQIKKEITETKIKIYEAKKAHVLSNSYAIEIYIAGLEHYLKALEHIQQNMCSDNIFWHR